MPSSGKEKEMSLSTPISVEEKNRVAMVAVMSSLSYSFCSVSMVMSNKVSKRARVWPTSEPATTASVPARVLFPLCVKGILI